MKNMPIIQKIVLAFIVLMLAVGSMLSSGCTETEGDKLFTTSYKSLKVTNEIYKQTIKSAKTMHEEGLLDDEKFNKTMEIGEKVYGALKSSALLLYSYKAALERCKEEEKAAIGEQLKAAMLGLFTKRNELVEVASVFMKKE